MQTYFLAKCGFTRDGLCSNLRSETTDVHRAKASGIIDLTVIKVNKHKEIKPFWDLKVWKGQTSKQKKQMNRPSWLESKTFNFEGFILFYPRSKLKFLTFSFVFYLQLHI